MATGRWNLANLPGSHYAEGAGVSTTRLQRLFEEQGQSPWLDNLNRGYLVDGTLSRLIADGVRGITSNPTIFQRAISGHADYDEQSRELAHHGEPSDQIFWELAIADVVKALDLLGAVYDESNRVDGFVSLELAPGLARDTEGSIAAGRQLRERIGRPNLYVKMPSTAEGIAAGRELLSEGCSVNFTLVCSPERYGEVADAYLAALEASPGDLAGTSSIVAYFVSRIDTEVDRRLEEVGTPEALALQGKAAVAQARLAYQVYLDRFGGERWGALAARGAHPQRLMWASTSTKNPAYPDLLYVDSLIGPGTVNTMPDATLAAFEEHGTVERTIDRDVDGAKQVMAGLREVGIDIEDVTRVVEEEGLAGFAKSFDELLQALTAKALELTANRG